MDEHEDWQDGEIDLLVFGPARGWPWRPRQWPSRWTLWLAVGALVVAGVVAAVLDHANRSHSRGRPAVAGSSLQLPSPVPSARPTAPARARTVTRLGHVILPDARGWQLFTLSAADVGRLDPSSGQLVTTPLPVLQSDGPVSFLAVAGEALVRPIDVVPGYVVPDGTASRLMPARLASSGPILPGPDQRHVWVQATGGAALELSALGGSRTGVRIRRIPAGDSVLDAATDGRGYLLFPAAKGFYDVRADGAHLISSTSLVALGPGRWLARDCRSAHRCTLVAIDASGQRRTIPVRAPGGSPYGAVSPTGTFAALYTVGRVGRLSLSVLDLATGATRHVDTSPAQSPGGTIAWSPDGRWLLMVDSAGHVDAVTPRTGRAVRLPRLAGVTQLVVRPDAHG